MEFEKVIRERKSTRLFNKTKVEQEKLDQILEAGRLAPTAKNNQPFKVYVINSEEGIKKLDQATPCRYGASTVLLVCGDTEKAFVKNGFPIYVMDASIVATHMMLEATNIGVDNIWIEMFDGKKIKELYDIPSDLEPVCLLPIGYKSKLCPPSPMHKIRKSMDKIVEYK